MEFGSTWLICPLVIGRVIEFRTHEICSQAIKPHHSCPLAIVLYISSPEFVQNWNLGNTDTKCFLVLIS